MSVYHPIRGWVIPDYLEIRYNPSLSGKILWRVPREHMIESSLECDEWLLVELEDGQIGWCAKRFLEFE